MVGNDAISLYVIYDHPSDYPDHYVVREWRVPPGGPVQVNQDCWLAGSLELAREFVPGGHCNIGRQEEDDPKIAEVWI